MKNYQFLLKPLFYIASLIFSSWMVLEIEKYNPPDPGNRKETGMLPMLVTHEKKCQRGKECLKQLVYRYRAGAIDTTGLNAEIDNFFREHEWAQLKD